MTITFYLTEVKYFKQDIHWEYIDCCSTTVKHGLFTRVSSCCERRMLTRERTWTMSDSELVITYWWSGIKIWKGEWTLAGLGIAN